MNAHQIAIYQLAEHLKYAHNITVLSGAGMSTESGIPDFRSYNGLWTQNHSLIDVVSIDFFRQNPQKFWQAFKDIFRLKLAANYQPNAGHQFLAWLETQGKHVNIITQNIDGLHQAAGSTNVLEIHGTLHQHVCLECGKSHDLTHINQQDIPRCCQCDNILKPNVVLYGEPVQQIDQAFALTLSSDVFIVMGSSLEVGPVNLLPLHAYRAHIPSACINLGATRWDEIFDIQIDAAIGSTVTELKTALKA